MALATVRAFQIAVTEILGIAKKIAAKFALDTLRVVVMPFIFPIGKAHNVI